MRRRTTHEEELCTIGTGSGSLQAMRHAGREEPQVSWILYRMGVKVSGLGHDDGGYWCLPPHR